jgi:hypothetical protein
LGSPEADFEFGFCLTKDSLENALNISIVEGNGKEAALGRRKS